MRARLESRRVCLQIPEKKVGEPLKENQPRTVILEQIPAVGK